MWRCTRYVTHSLVRLLRVILAATFRIPTPNGLGQIVVSCCVMFIAKVQAKGYVIGNLDVTIMAQAPKMAPHIDAMCATIAQDLQTEVDNVNVKATTTERLGFTGRKEGIAAEAVVVLFKAAA